MPIAQKLRVEAWDQAVVWVGVVDWWSHGMGGAGLQACNYDRCWTASAAEVPSLANLPAQTICGTQQEPSTSLRSCREDKIFVDPRPLVILRQRSHPQSG